MSSNELTPGILVVGIDGSDSAEHALYYVRIQPGRQKR
jgi:hypothetical protein